MQARARVRYLKVSPKKMRLVANLIKGKPVEEAMNILNFTPKVAAHHMAKTLKAAAANAISSVGTAKLKAEDLLVTRVVVDAAPTAKRIRFQSMGRVFRIRKRFCHVTIEVEGEPEPEAPKTRGGRRRKKETVESDEPKAVKKTTAKKTTRTKTATKTKKAVKADKIDDTQDVVEETKATVATKDEAGNAAETPEVKTTEETADDTDTKKDKTDE